MRFLERDDFKPPTVEDQLRALHAKVHASNAGVTSRMDKLEAHLVAISAKLDRPPSTSFIARQKSRPRSLSVAATPANATATAASVAAAAPEMAAPPATDAAGVGGSSAGDGHSVLRSALSSSRQELREDSAGATASCGSPFEA